MTQRALVRGAQDHAGRLARLECFLPTRSTEAPTVAGFQAAKAEFRHRCRKIVAAGFGKLEKRGGHDGADRVATDVRSPNVAAAVSKEPPHWADRAGFEPPTEHDPAWLKRAGVLASIAGPQPAKISKILIGDSRCRDRRGGFEAPG